MKPKFHDENTRHIIAGELAKPHHLVTAESRGRPLCGEPSPDAAIGSYVEHLDEKGEFVREVFGKGGKPALACEQCLALYPSLERIGRDERELKRITPFNMQINVAFTPYMPLDGYRINASGIAEVEDKRIGVFVRPQINFTNARCLYSLMFDLTVDAPLVVPLVNKANKDT